MTPDELPLQRYHVEHETRYAYAAPVSQSWQLARLTPRRLPWQALLSHSLQIDPQPDERRDELDSFGNTVTHFGLHGAHRVLRVRMECLVEVSARPAVQGAAAFGVQSQLQSQSLGEGDDDGQVLSQSQSQSQSQQAMAFDESAWEAVRDAIRREPQQDNLAPAKAICVGAHGLDQHRPDFLLPSIFVLSFDIGHGS